jgi:hypothetical protein
MPDNSLDFFILDEMTSTVEHKAQLASQIVLFQDLFVWHVEHDLELHEQSIQKLLVTAEENLPLDRTLLEHLAIFAFGDFDSKGSAKQHSKSQMKLLMGAIMSMFMPFPQTGRQPTLTISRLVL